MFCNPQSKVTDPFTDGDVNTVISYVVAANDDEDDDDDDDDDDRENVVDAVPPLATDMVMLETAVEGAIRMVRFAATSEVISVKL